MTALAVRRRALVKPYRPYDNTGIRPLVSDSFTRADSSSSAGSTDSYDGASLGSIAWTTAGGATFGINGDALYAPAGSSDGYLIAPGVGQTVEVRAIIQTLPGGSSGTSIGLIAGYVDSNNFILGLFRGDGAVFIYNRVGGTFNELTVRFHNGFIAGDEIGMRLEPCPDSEAPGFMVTLLRNGALLYDSTGAESISQAIIPTSTFNPGTGVGFREDSSDTTWRITNFRAYPIAGRPSMARTYPAVLAPISGEGGEVLGVDVKFLAGKWVMNYSTDEGATRLAYQAGSATVPPLGTWTREAGNPILTPISGEGGYAFNGSIVEFAGTFYLYYSTNNGPDGTGNTPATSLATATDLAGPWTRQGIVTLTGHESYSGDQFAEVIDSGAAIRLWFTDGSSMFCCTSTDGTTFTTPVNIFPLAIWAPWSSAGAPFAFTDPAGAVHLWWCGNASKDNECRSTHEAVSYDFDGTTATTWPDIRPYRLPVGPSGQFDDLQTIDNSPVLIGDTVYLFYSGCSLPGGVLGLDGSIGLAIGPNY